MLYPSNKTYLAKFGNAFILTIFLAGCSANHQERAQKHLLISLREYEKSIYENPHDLSLQERYYAIARVALGETQAKTELSLIYRAINKEKEANFLLSQLISKNAGEECSKYLEKKLDVVYNLQQRIYIYQALTYLNPQNPSFFDKLGRLYLGIEKTPDGIEALSKSIELGNRNPDSVNYLVRAYEKEKRYQDAVSLLKMILSEKEDLKFRNLLANVYKKQGKKDLYLAEIEKLNKKTPLIAFKKPEIQKIEKKPSEPEKILLSQRIDVEPYKFLVVDKSSQNLSVYQFDGIEIKKILQLPCTTGKNMEDKKRQGDLATPEGTFLIKFSIPGEKLDPKYGAGAYVLDFPDYLSKRLNKDGRGIWLHGTPIERPPYNSEGCVVVNDRDFQTLQQYIKPGYTYIHIVKHSKDINFSEINIVWETLQQWKKSWEALDNEKYLSFYDENFRSDGKDKKTWAEYKKRVNRNKQFVKVELERPVIVPYGNTGFGYVFLLDAIQRYESNNLRSITRKNIYLAKNNGSYKIIGELVK
ncbi:MAG: L,D-transpeptidase family protein [Candidatus Omnitrophica bacterium]|nr:L,D-transpeptidase family protein [Candidatus Omnitrophota bacterium]